MLSLFKLKIYFLLFVIFVKALLNNAFDEFLLDPLKQNNFRCAGQTIKDAQCPSGICYDAINIQNDLVSIGCATSHMCKTEGCFLNKTDNLFVCCCSNTYCNGKSKRLVKAYWQKYQNDNFLPKIVEQTNSQHLFKLEKQLINTGNLANQNSINEKIVSLTTLTKLTFTTTKPTNEVYNSTIVFYGQNNTKEYSNLPFTLKPLNTTTLKSALKITTKLFKPTKNKFSAKLITSTSSTMATKKIPFNEKDNTTNVKTITKTTLSTTIFKIPNEMINQTSFPTPKKQLQQNSTKKKLFSTTTLRPSKLPEYITTGIPEYKRSNPPNNKIISKAPKIESLLQKINKTVKIEPKVDLNRTTTLIKIDENNKQKIDTKKTIMNSSLPKILKKIITNQQIAAKPVNGKISESSLFAQTTTKETTSPLYAASTKPKVNNITKILIQKSSVQNAFSTNELKNDKTTRSFIADNQLAINRHKNYRSFPWYCVVVFGFIVFVIAFAIIYILIRKCKKYMHWPTVRSKPRKSLQRFKDHDRADDEICDKYQGSNFSSEHSSANLLKLKKSSKRHSLLFAFRPNKSKTELLIKPNTTNDSLVSQCTTITTIPPISNTSPIKKKEKSPINSSFGKSTSSKSRALDADRELTVIDPFLNKQFTETIHIVEPSKNKITTN